MQFGVMLAAHYVFNDVTYAPIITSTMMLLQKQYLDLMTVWSHHPNVTTYYKNLIT